MFLAEQLNIPRLPSVEDAKAPPGVASTVRADDNVPGHHRVVFNIKGNKYRLVVGINYPYRMCYVRFLGSHQAYDRIDVMSV